MRDPINVEDTDYDIVVSDNVRLLNFMKDRIHVRGAWEEEGAGRVTLDGRFMGDLFQEVQVFLAQEGLAHRLFKSHTSPLERILMERFNAGWGE
ncbi:hypothetical protein [Thermococcus sp.]|uniref:hypothetical protein n=1 Tax=Thermococcus sp. TaxID=35749 RepID=UPI0026189AE8|nr:hypothetical protein [Thermococcus sp.]